MDHPLNAIPGLLAKTDRFSQMSRGFRRDGATLDAGDVLTGLLAIGGVALLAWLLWYVNFRHKGLRKRNGPLRLFLELCGAHRLRWTERWLLWRLARAAKLPNPAQLFLEPERFDPLRLPGPLQSRVGAFRRLKTRLFADPLDASGEEGKP